jgi:peptidoglycan/xylan/chitin deacetylase (PgdA/CDA1 family)
MTLRKLAFALVVGGMVTFAAVVTPLIATAAGTTTVSLTFDDGQATQMQALPLLTGHGMHGTFYLNSGLVGSSGYYMTWSQVMQLSDAGNEIGGHTVDHAHLTALSTADAQKEICDDRVTLQQHGYNPVSFAYPFAESNSTVEQLVQQCGYASGRTVGDLYGPDCTDCAYAETIPPRDPYYVRTPAPVVNTLADLESYVTNAESHGGGWVPLVFHTVSSSCSSTDCVSPQTLSDFMDWLQPRSSSGTVVRTVGEAMGASQPATDTTPPATSVACNGAPCSSWNKSATVGVALSATDSGSGVASTVYTTDGTDPATSSTVTTYMSAPFPISQTTTVKYFSTDNAGNREATHIQLVRIDNVAPAVAITSPASSSSMRKGTKVKVVATATDNGTGGGTASGVANVAYYLDRTTLLGRVSASPYQLVWDSRKASYGGHTLTAVATDVAGNSTTSSPVTVTITR